MPNDDPEEVGYLNTLRGQCQATVSAGQHWWQSPKDNLLIIIVCVHFKLLAIEDPHLTIKLSHTNIVVDHSFASRRPLCRRPVCAVVVSDTVTVRRSVDLHGHATLSKILCAGGRCRASVNLRFCAKEKQYKL